MDNHDFSTSDFDENILKVEDNFCFNLNNNNNKIVLSLTWINQWGHGDIKCNMIDNNSINIIYKEKIGISKKFDENDMEFKLQLSNKFQNNYIQS